MPCLALVPAVQDLVVQAFLAAEVVGDQLGVDAGPVGDRSDAGAGEALLRELRERGVDDALTGPLRIALPLGGLGGSPGVRARLPQRQPYRPSSPPSPSSSVTESIICLTLITQMIDTDIVVRRERISHDPHHRGPRASPSDSARPRHWPGST